LFEQPRAQSFFRVSVHGSQHIFFVHFLHAKIHILFVFDVLPADSFRALPAYAPFMACNGRASQETFSRKIFFAVAVTAANLPDSRFLLSFLYYF